MEWKIWKNFIVIEGLDGSGTSTQSRLLEEYFKKQEIPCFLTHEPGSSLLEDFIRRLLKGEKQVRPRSFAFLFTADREEHLFNAQNGIINHHKAGKWIICDRYLFSTLAYQSADCGFDFILQLNSAFPLPEYLFYLDTSAETCQKRRELRSDEKEIFDENIFQQSLIKQYEKVLSYFKDSPMKIFRIPGEKDLTSVHKAILKKLNF